MKFRLMLQMHEPWKHHAKEKKPDTKHCMLYDDIYMKYLK